MTNQNNYAKKYFGTDGIRGKVGTFPITAEFVLKLGFAAGKVLGNMNGDGGKILIGKDTRISGYMFESALEAGLVAAGMDPVLLGPMPTAAIPYLTRTQRAKAGIVITASHNPYTDNGIKFFCAEGMKLPDNIEIAIEQALEKPFITVDSAKLGKAARMPDAPGRYIEFCKSTIPNTVTLKNMKIVLDCANGATYHIAPHVLRELGAEVIELGVDPDGFNINHQCGSMEPTYLKNKVIQEKADLGIALDGDGDRVLMIDHQGEILDGDDLLYIIAKYYSQKNKLSGGIVGTLMSNMGLELALQKLGLSFVRANVGDRYVISELLKQKWLLGGEPSGHIVWLRSTTTGDGIISALQVLSAIQETKKNCHELKSDFIKFPQQIKNIAIKPGSEPLKNKKLKDAVQASELLLNHPNHPNQGRIVLRVSGTESVLRIMVESKNENLVSEIIQKLSDIAASLL